MIYVIIPVFNRIEYTTTCLKLLKAQIFSDIQPIVVDDGSTDGTSEIIRAEFPSVKLVQGSGDWYWTGSVYQGVERALELSQSDEDYVLMLNDDLEFGSDLVQELVAFSRTKPRAIVQALGAWTDKRDIIQYAGMKINWWTAKGRFPYEGESRRNFSEDHIEYSDTLTGRGVLFPILVFREVGNYDRRIVHRGDPELTRRAAKAGWDLIVYFGAVVYSIPVKGEGNVNEREIYRLSDFREYFFGVLSSSHVPTLWRNSCAYTYSKFQGIVFFGCSLARHIWHFIKKTNFNIGR